MEKLDVTSKVVTARLEQVDTESMAEFNAVVEGRKRVRLVFSAIAENHETTENPFQSWCASHTSNALASVASRLEKDVANGILFKDDPTAATTAEQTIVG